MAPIVRSRLLAKPSILFHNCFCLSSLASDGRAVLISHRPAQRVIFCAGSGILLILINLFFNDLTCIWLIKERKCKNMNMSIYQYVAPSLFTKAWMIEKRRRYQRRNSSQITSTITRPKVPPNMFIDILTVMNTIRNTIMMMLGEQIDRSES